MYHLIRVPHNDKFHIIIVNCPDHDQQSDDSANVQTLKV